MSGRQVRGNGNLERGEVGSGSKHRYFFFSKTASELYSTREIRPCRGAPVAVLGVIALLVYPEVLTRLHTVHVLRVFVSPVCENRYLFKQRDRFLPRHARADAIAR